MSRCGLEEEASELVTREIALIFSDCCPLSRQYDPHIEVEHSCAKDSRLASSVTRRSNP